MDHPPQPNHVMGTSKGEEVRRKKGHEAGREGKRGYRTARDSTSINPLFRTPVDPRMPEMPPA